jgi:methylated-DNA-[protein]-cysteine S-methyltransferase
MTIEYAVIPSPVGRVGIAWTERALVLAEMDVATDRTSWDTDYVPGGTVARLRERLSRRFPGADLRRGSDTAPPVRALRRYFDGDLSAPDALAVDPGGRGFRGAVWREIRRIPPGKTATYGELAARAGRPGAARAAGGAVGSNPIPIVIPCHRVVGADGRLTGFGGGLSRKRWLLEHEGAVAGSRQLRFA